MLWPFNKYPGTDYETYNWAWLISTVKRLQTTVDNWVNDIKDYVLEILSDHPEWIQNWMLDDGSVTLDKVESPIADLVEFGGSAFFVSANILGELTTGYDSNTAMNYGAQGLTHITDNIYLAYFNPASGNSGRLTAVDMSTHSILWSINPQLYHGSSMTYNPDNDTVYVAGWETDNGDPIKNVLTFTYSNPGNINVITIPSEVAGEKLLAIAYNRERQEWFLYFDVASGAVYSTSDFITYNRINLLDMRITQGNASIQDMCSEGNYIYVAYSAPGAFIEIFDMDGNKVGVKNIPDRLNQYRRVFELESITYNSETEQFVAMSFLQTTGIPETWLATLFELGIKKDVLEARPATFYTNAGYAAGTMPIAYVKNTPSLYPRIYVNEFTCIDDALNYVSSMGKDAVIAIDATASDQIVRNYNINTNGSVKIAKRGDYEVFLENVTPTSANIVFETVSFRETDISPENSALAAKYGAFVHARGCKFYILNHACYAADSATIALENCSYEELDGYTGGAYLKADNFGTIIKESGSFAGVSTEQSAEGNIVYPAQVEKTSSTSFLDASGDEYTTSGVGGALDVLKTNISNYSNYSVSTATGDAGGPLYAILLIKATDSNFGGVAVGYRSNKMYQFSFTNNKYTIIEK